MRRTVGIRSEKLDLIVLLLVGSLFSVFLWLLGQMGWAAYLFVGVSLAAGMGAAVRGDLDSLMAAVLALGIGFPILQAGIPFGYRLPPALIIALVLLWKSHRRGPRVKMPVWLVALWGLLLIGGVNFFRLFARSETSYAIAQMLWLGAGVAVAWLALDWAGTWRRGPGDRFFWATGLVGGTLLVIPSAVSLSNRIGLDLSMDPNGVAVLAGQVILAFVLLYMLYPSRKAAMGLGISAGFSGLVLIATASRQGIVIAVVILLAVVAGNRRIGPTLRAIAVVTLVMAMVFGTVTEERKRYVLHRFDRAAEQGASSSRIAHLRVAVSIAVSHPLGVGSAGFRYFYRETASSLGIYSGKTFPRPHGLLPMALADWGLPGGFLYLLGMVSLGISSFSSSGPVGAGRKTAFLVVVLGSLASTRLPLLALAMAAYPGPLWWTARSGGLDRAYCARPSAGIFQHRLNGRRQLLAPDKMAAMRKE